MPCGDREMARGRARQGALLNFPDRVVNFAEEAELKFEHTSVHARSSAV